MLEGRALYKTEDNKIYITLCWAFVVVGIGAPNACVSPSLIKHCGFPSQGSITVESQKYLSNILH